MTRHLIGLPVICALGFLVIPLPAEAQPPVKGPGSAPFPMTKEDRPSGTCRCR